MRRIAQLICIVFLAVSCGADDPTSVTQPPDPTDTAVPTPTATPEPTHDLGKFDSRRAMDHVRALAVEIGKREAGTPGDAEAVTYIAGRLERIGWDVREDVFPLPQGGKSSNVIGTPEGFDETKPYMIVGGHRDSINGPGANDNATGVAAVLEIARALNERPTGIPVMAIAFGAEEQQPGPERAHHVGSIHHVDRMSGAARENLRVMVNVDMVGHGDVITCGRLAVGPQDGTKRCLAEGKKLRIDVEERVTPDWSDHGTFQKRGMNIAWLWTGEHPCCYHNERDTIATVRQGDVRRSGLLALAILRSYGDDAGSLQR